jgi:hypothetical protein
MSIYAPKTEKKAFDVHPAGSYAAVLCDMYLLNEVNFFHGKETQSGEIDERLTVQKLYLCFLTESMIDIEGEAKPRWIRQGYNFSLGDNSGLAKTLRQWRKELMAVKSLYKHFDEVSGISLESLIGYQAYIEITHKPNLKNPESPYCNITNILPLPKFNPESGEPIKLVQIPHEYKRSDAAKLQENADKRILERNPSWANAMNNTAKKLKETPKAKAESKPAAAIPSDEDLDLPF